MLLLHIRASLNEQLGLKFFQVLHDWFKKADSYNLFFIIKFTATIHIQCIAIQ